MWLDGSVGPPSELRQPVEQNHSHEGGVCYTQGYGLGTTWRKTEETWEVL